MQMRLPPDIRPVADQGGLTFEHGAFAGRNYHLELKVCPNPCCHCKEIELHCAPEKPAETAVPVGPSCLMMDIRKCKIIVPGQGEQNSARELGQALIQEIAPVHWQMLAERFLAVKRRITEQDDLTGFTPTFPAETLVNSGPMVGYHEILPYAERLDVVSEGRSWVLDEQYCLHDPCSCHQSALTFIRVDEPSKGRRRKPVTVTFRYNFHTGVYERETHTSLQDPLPEILFSALRDKYPDLNSALAQHQRKLMRLLAKAKGGTTTELQSPQIFAATGPAPTGDFVRSPSTGATKPGRNDPCPCGSGKKYKKCCGK